MLSAKAADGKLYAERLLRALPDITVHSRWDGGTPSRTTTEWREDIGSVLVGTKSLLTGVDAPGETCSLVIVDRIPRSPSNPIDDARVEELEARTGDRWAEGSTYTPLTPRCSCRKPPGASSGTPPTVARSRASTRVC